MKTEPEDGSQWPRIERPTPKYADGRRISAPAVLAHGLFDIVSRRGAGLVFVSRPNIVNFQSKKLYFFIFQIGLFHNVKCALLNYP